MSYQGLGQQAQGLLANPQDVLDAYNANESNLHAANFPPYSWCH